MNATKTTGAQTTTTQRAAAEQAIGYMAAWVTRHDGPMIGSVKVLFEMLERAAGPTAMADALASWEAATA